MVHPYTATTNKNVQNLMCLFVPLKLVRDDTVGVVWENSKASSTFYSRPLYFKFAKENNLNITEVALIEIEN